MILFLQATKHLKDKGFNIEYLYAADIREHKPDWTHPSFLVDWLLDSDFHGLFCQGIHNQMFGIWKPIDCVEEIKRLEYHNGDVKINNKLLTNVSFISVTIVRIDVLTFCLP